MFYLMFVQRITGITALFHRVVSQMITAIFYLVVA